MTESASVECTECREALAEVEALSRSELCGIITSLVAACHATHPHTAHTLKACIPEVRGVERELRIRCLHWSCKDVEPLVTRCPIELVGALTLVFHTSHEGHPLEFSFDGRTWSSPTSPQSPESRRHGPTQAHPT